MGQDRINYSDLNSSRRGVGQEFWGHKGLSAPTIDDETSWKMELYPPPITGGKQWRSDENKASRFKKEGLFEPQPAQEHPSIPPTHD